MLLEWLNFIAISGSSPFLRELAHSACQPIWTRSKVGSGLARLWTGLVVGLHKKVYLASGPHEQVRSGIDEQSELCVLGFVIVGVVICF